MVLCDWCRKRKGTHRSKTVIAFRPKTRSYTVLCDGCWKLSKFNMVSAAKRCGDWRD